MTTNGRIDELIKKFNKINGDNRYTQRDLLKYVISKLDDLDNKIDVCNNKLDNHISHSLQRITINETILKNMKWILGFIISGIVSLGVAIGVILINK